MTLIYYPGGKAMKCDRCDAPVGEKDERFWDSETKKRYCGPCGKDRGGSASTATPTTNQQTLTKQLVKCPLAGRFFPENEMITVYTRSMEQMRISQLAADIITVQYWAKIAGLWTVPNPKNVEEAKA